MKIAGNTGKNEIKMMKMMKMMKKVGYGNEKWE